MDQELDVITLVRALLLDFWISKISRHCRFSLTSLRTWKTYFPQIDPVTFLLMVRDYFQPKKVKFCLPDEGASAGSERKLSKRTKSTKDEAILSLYGSNQHRDTEPTVPEVILRE